MAITLLSSSAKSEKGRAKGWLSAVLYLEPSLTLCPFSTKACRAACLVHSGRLPMPKAQNARAKRTELYYSDRALFYELLEAELLTHKARARMEGLKPCVRLDGTSDTGMWAEFDAFLKGHEIQSYDYTKDYDRAVANPEHYTFSFSGGVVSRRKALSLLGTGGRVAVIFQGQDLPSEWEGFPVIDGDVDDLRFLDPPGVVVGLRLKGTNAAKEAAINGRLAQ